MSEQLKQFEKYFFWIIQILVGIVGFFLVTAINNFSDVIKENQQRIHILESRVSVIEHTNEIMLNRIEMKIDDLKDFTQEKFNRYDKDIQDFYKTYDLKKRQ